MTHLRPIIVMSVALIGAASLQSTTGARGDAVPASRPSSRPNFPAFAPIAYYAQSCARCHGPEGTFYGPTLGKNMTDAALQKVVAEMAAGPGGSPLSAADLAAETAYHRALIQKTPFIAVTNFSSNGLLSGEVTSGSEVTVTIEKASFKATVDDVNWSVQLPPGARLESITVKAVSESATTTIANVTESGFSHLTPISGTGK